eukprot:1158991-Pelagomonas_calceolata.AAC.8
MASLTQGSSTSGAQCQRAALPAHTHTCCSSCTVFCHGKRHAGQQHVRSTVSKGCTTGLNPPAAAPARCWPWRASCMAAAWAGGACFLPGQRSGRSQVGLPVRWPCKVKGQGIRKLVCQ